MKNISSKADAFLSRVSPSVKKILSSCLLVYCGLGTVLFVFQEKYIYYPYETNFQDCPSFAEADKILFGSSRGYLTKRSPENIVVYYHGNAGSACDRAFMDSFFANQDYSTFFAEYSGYGEKGQKSSMSNLLQNVVDTIDFLKTQNFKKIVVVGESVGVGPAAYHALHSGIDKLILVTAYNNLADVAFSHYPFYPMRLLLRNNFTPDTWLAHYKGSVSIIVAENDEIIPNKLSQKLYENIPSDLKKIYTVKNAGHNSIYEMKNFTPC